MKIQIELHAADKRFNRLVEFLKENNIDWSAQPALLQTDVRSSAPVVELCHESPDGKVEVVHQYVAGDMAQAKNRVEKDAIERSIRYSPYFWRIAF